MAKIYTQINFEDPTYNTHPNFLAGIECEVESINYVDAAVPSFKAEADGSLRNNGTEFISVPLEREHLINEFKNLHANIVFHDKKEAFSPRTSTHVHVNVRNLDEVNVKNMLLFYALFEEFFFAMVNPVRRENIHCVPLNETLLPTKYKQSIWALAKGWHKYTALNLLPIMKLGTVEFRHLQGTDDDALLDRWLKTLENLWTLCQVQAITPTTLTNEKTIEEWFKTIFKDAPEIMALAPTLKTTIANSLIDVKLSQL